jgi:phosphotriesterase-related protein
MTVPGLGRDPALVARAVAGTGLRVMFATGYYTYDNLPFPFHYRGRGKILDDEDRTLESLFERDVTAGIGDTGFRAAVLKIVTDEPGMTPDVERLAIAVANVHARTGTPVCTHAHAPSKRGLEQQQILAACGADLGRVMIGHSNETTDLGYLEQIIAGGSYVGWDRCGLAVTVPLAGQLDTLATLCERGYASRIMLAHDKASFTDWFTNAEQDFVLPDWQFTYIHGALLPGLRERGVTDEQIEQMLVRNPREFFGG